MNAKNLSIVAYLTIIGWAVSFFNFNKGNKSKLLNYHLKQSFGVFLLSALFGILIKIVALFSLSLASILSWAGILIFILLVLGIINALNETEKPIPIVGKFFENKFTFIK